MLLLSRATGFSIFTGHLSVLEEVVLLTIYKTTTIGGDGVNGSIT